MSDFPSEVHCLACKSRQPFTNGKYEDTKFLSRKKGVEMTRYTLAGTCGKCGKKVKHFVSRPKTEPEPDPAQAPTLSPPLYE